MNEDESRVPRAPIFNLSERLTKMESSAAFAAFFLPD